MGGVKSRIIKNPETRTTIAYYYPPKIIFKGLGKPLDRGFIDVPDEGRVNFTIRADHNPSRRK